MPKLVSTTIPAVIHELVTVGEAEPESVLSKVRAAEKAVQVSMSAGFAAGDLLDGPDSPAKERLVRQVEALQDELDEIGPETKVVAADLVRACDGTLEHVTAIQPFLNGHKTAARAKIAQAETAERTGREPLL